MKETFYTLISSQGTVGENTNESMHFKIPKCVDGVSIFSKDGIPVGMIIVWNNLAYSFNVEENNL